MKSSLTSMNLSRLKMKSSHRIKRTKLNLLSLIIKISHRIKMIKSSHRMESRKKLNLSSLMIKFSHRIQRRRTKINWIRSFSKKTTNSLMNDCLKELVENDKRAKYLTPITLHRILIPKFNQITIIEMIKMLCFLRII